MNKAVIFEGISSSGKTSVSMNLCRFCDERHIDYSFVKEAQTIMPMIDNEDPAEAVRFLAELLEQELSTDKPLHIFDRLHVSHGFKTGNTIAPFSQIESELKRVNALLVVIRVAEEEIESRIREAIKYKDPKWGEYMIRKHGSIEAIGAFLAERQRNIEKMAQESQLDKLVLTINEYDYVRPTRRIIDTLGINTV